MCKYLCFKSNYNYYFLNILIYKNVAPYDTFRNQNDIPHSKLRKPIPKKNGMRFLVFCGPTSYFDFWKQVNK